jgi:hypothetical protein
VTASLYFEEGGGRGFLRINQYIATHAASSAGETTNETNATNSRIKE